MMAGRSREEIQAEADARNAVSSARPGPYQHWYVHTDGYGDCLTCEWRHGQPRERMRQWLIEKLGGSPT